METEVDCGISDNNSESFFISPYKRFDIVCEDTDIDPGMSPDVTSIQQDNIIPKFTQRKSKAQKRLILEESSSEESDVSPEWPSEVAKKRRKSYSPKKKKRRISTSSEDDRIPEHHKRKRGVSSVVGIKQLKQLVCCSLTCFALFTTAYLQSQRDSFKSKSLYAQRQWVLGYLNNHSNTTEDELIQYIYLLGTTVICAKAWRMIYGITERRFYSIKKMFQDGIRRFATPNRSKKGKHGTQALECMAWLEYYARTFGDKLPQDERYHLPSCLTKHDVYVLLKDDFEITDREPCCESYFYELWRKYFQKKIAIPKENRFAKCDFCTKIKTKLENTNLSKEKRLKYIQKREKHLHLQNEERRKYYKHAEKSRRYPHKYACMIMDGMDQNKTSIPHFYRLSKSSANIYKLRTHVTGAIIHGVAKYGYFDYMQWPHDSNLTINVLLYTLYRIRDRLPDTLYLQMDNCYRENKNKWVFAFCCLLVEKKIFSKVKVNFLMVGHTHEDIDQLFSRFSTWLTRHSATTLVNLMKGFQRCCTPNPVSVEVSNIFDIRKWLTPHLNTIYGHSAPHCFRFLPDESGKCVMFTKKWSGDPEWTPCVIGEGKSNYLLMTTPQGLPDVISPDLEDLHLPRLKSDLASVHTFMKPEERSWWSSWFDNIEGISVSTSNADHEFEEMPAHWYFEELLDSARSRPAFSFRNDPEEDGNTQLSDVEDDSTEILPVHLGAPPRRNKQKELPTELKAGDLAALDTEKYSDFWPQIGEIKQVGDLTVELVWYKGAKTTTWKPWMIRKGKDRVPWTEEVRKNDIIISGFALTRGGKLTQECLRKLEDYERKF